MEEKQARKWLLGLLVATVLVLSVNAMNLSSLSKTTGSITGFATAEGTNGVIPTGTPKIYGKELGISFDGVSPSNAALADATIRKMANIDRSVTLNAADNKRYINILYTLNKGMSCEYCCGAKSIIFGNGQAACGCAHSYAMRGLAKYLITKHGKEYTDTQIQEEVGKWKTLFFPGQMTLKAKALKAKGIKFSYVNLASNLNRGIEQGKSAGGMVGGC